MFGEFRVLLQVLDFAWKGLQAYVQTAEGQKELDDIVKALDDVDTGSQATTPGTIEGVIASSLEAARAARRAKSQ